MYEIATLKTKKLPELQEIAKTIGIKRIAGLKKLELIYQIVDFIAAKPDEEPQNKAEKSADEKPQPKATNKVLPVQKAKAKAPHDNTQQQNQNQNQKKQGPNNGNSKNGNSNRN